MNVRKVDKVPQQAGTVWMQFCCEDAGARILFRQQRSLAARRSASVEDPLAMAHHHRHQLGSFVLSANSAFAKGPRSGGIARIDAARIRQECSRRELNTRFYEFSLGLMVVDANRRGRNGLVVDADLPGRIKTAAISPPRNQPLRVSGARSQLARVRAVFD